MPKVEPLVLSTNTGKKVQFSLSQFIDIAANTEKYLRQAEDLLTLEPETNLDMAIALINRFGCRHPKDMMNLLHSREGDEILGFLTKRIAEIVFQKEQMQRNIQLAELKHERELMLLLLSLAYQESEDEQDELLESIDSKKEHKTTSNVESNANHAGEIMAALNRNISTYKAAATVLENELNEKIKASEQLELEMTNLETQIQAAQERHNIYVNALHDQEHLDLCEQAFALSTVEPSRESTEQLDEITQRVEEKLKALKESLDRQAVKIAADVDKYSGDAKKERSIRRFLAENTATNIQLANLKDMLDVVRGNKQLITSDGTQAQTFADAHFIMPKDRKIIKLGDEYYLLPPGVETLAELDEHERETARQAFLQLRPSLLVVNKLVHHNRDLESAEQQELLDGMTEKNENFQHDILLLSKRLQQVQMARANAETQLANIPAPSTGISTPRPMQTKPRPNPSGMLSRSYQQMLRLMSHGRPNPKSIADLGNLAPNARGTLSQLKAGQRIPPKMLEKLRTYDIDEYSRTTPSPFNTRPSPYGKSRPSS